MIKDNTSSLFNNGLRDFQSGNLINAEKTLKKVIKSSPKHSDAIHLLGVVANKRGDNKMALRFLRKAIKLRPNNAVFYRNIALVLVGMNKVNDAIYSFKKAIRLNSNDSYSHNDLGTIYSSLGETEKAIKEYLLAIKIDRKNYLAFNNLGNDFVKLRDFDRASDAFDMAIQIKPDYAEAYSGIGDLLAFMGKLEQALVSYDKAIQLKTDYAEAYNNRGHVLNELGDLEQAMESYDKAILLNPEYAGAYNNRGFILKEWGQIKRALASYEKAIQIKPDFAVVYRHITSIKTYKSRDSQIRLMESMYAESAVDSLDRMQLSYALSKAYGDLAEYSKSFSYLEDGNSIRAKELNYSVDNDRILFSKIKEIFATRNQDLDYIPDDNKTIGHIFIVGMPRSGTSLVEQILATHADVYGAGELETLGRIARPIISRLVDNDVIKLSEYDVSMIHNGYINDIGLLNINENIVSDKMPLNFQWIGFILLAFPTAKIINLNRDPMATCWSIYKHFFSSNGNGYAYDMYDLSEFYKLYVDLMSFWRDRFSNSIYDISYEKLTINQEEETRKLLKFCGLKWDKRCLDFHKTKRVVKTASSTQVRKKMYKGSSEAWKKYERYLQPLIDALEH